MKLLKGFWNQLVEKNIPHEIQLKNCDGEKLLLMYRKQLANSFDKLDHHHIISGIRRLRAYQSDTCPMPCLAYDVLIYMDEARALVTLCEAEIDSLVEVDKCLSKFTSSIDEVLKSLQDLPSVNFEIDKMASSAKNEIVSESFLEIDRIKTQLQRAYL